MILKQHYLACLSQASYTIADPAARTMAVVDPRRDVGIYLDGAAAAGCEIQHVFLTHFHADFISGHLELAECTGAEIHLGARARAEYPFTPMRDGESLELGAVRIGFLETPGHTPESCCLLVFDLARERERPYAVLTGDTLFVGDVGRPDLLVSAGCSAEELASMLYDSTREKLLTLPDETLVYPAHGAGSMCGKSLSSETFSTIGAQRATNHALAPMSREAFVAMATAGLPEAPRYFALDARKNREERDTLPRVLERSRALSLDEVLALTGESRRPVPAQVLDGRGASEYAGGHLEGSVHVGLEGRFAEWAGTVLDLERPIVLLVEPGREQEAATRLARVGLDRVEGFLEGGGAALAARPDRLRRLERLSPDALSERLGSETPPWVLDVRTDAERAQGAIPGSAHIPLRELERRIDEVPRDRPVVVHCAGGYRSTIAASLLEAHGRAAGDLEGGFSAWSARRAG